MDAASLWAGMRTVTVTGSGEDASGLGHHELRCEQLHVGIGRPPGAIQDDAFDEGDSRGEDQRQTHGAENDRERRRSGVVEDVPHAEHRARLRGLIDRRRARRHREPQQERRADGDACDDQADVSTEPAARTASLGRATVVVVRVQSRPEARCHSCDRERRCGALIPQGPWDGWSVARPRRTGWHVWSRCSTSVGQTPDLTNSSVGVGVVRYVGWDLVVRPRCPVTRTRRRLLLHRQPHHILDALLTPRLSRRRLPDGPAPNRVGSQPDDRLSRVGRAREAARAGAGRSA